MIEKKDIKDQVEERLIDAQKAKEFKDIGRVSGSRKAAAAFKLITMQSLEQIELDPVMAYKMVKKETVFPKYEPIDQKALGVTSGACYLKTKIRESVASKPKDNVIARSAYVKFCEKLYNDLLVCKTIDEIYKITNFYEEWDTRTKAVYLLHPILEKASEDDVNTALYLKQRELKKYYSLSVKDLMKDLVGVGFVNMFYRKSDAAAVNWNDARLFDAVTKEQEQHNLIKQKEQKEFAFNREKANLDKTSAMSTEQFHRFVVNFYRNPPSLREFKDQTKSWSNEAYYRLLIQQRYDKELARLNSNDPLPKGKHAQEEDWSWAEIKSTSQPKEVTKADPNVVSLKINTKQPLDYIRRDNGYGIPEVAAINVVDYFGFKAINYGNYVNDRESKEHTKHLLGALSDMGEMLNMNIKQLNQLGGLSLGIGLKGRPGALATYFSQTKDINLTKNNGDGSLCHEWGHYMDNAVVDLGQVKATNIGFGSQGEAVKPLTAQRYKVLMDGIIKGFADLPQKRKFRIKAVDGAPRKFYSSNSGKAYSPEDYLKPTIEETLDYVKEALVKSTNSQSNEYLSEFLGRIVNHFGKEEDVIELQLKGMSYYYMVSASQGSAYWIKPVELFARAFETYVYRKLQKQKRMSTYLVALEWEFFGDKYVYGDKFYNEYMPYPMGEEAARLDELFESLIRTIKLEYFIGDFVPYTTDRVSEYIELQKSSKEMKVKEGVEVVKTPKGKIKTAEITETSVVEPTGVEVKTVKEESAEVQEESTGWGESVPELIQGLEVLATLSEGKEKQDVEDLIEGLKLLL